MKLFNCFENAGSIGSLFLLPHSKATSLKRDKYYIARKLKSQLFLGSSIDLILSISKDEDDVVG